MTNYVIAIPSYKRHNELSNKTLTLLKKYNINPDNIFIFVANKTERKLYEEFGFEKETQPKLLSNNQKS